LNDTIHIVCLDAPSPPDYGGAIDMYYKISSLAEQGKKIVLHYFDYHPGRSSSGIEQYCSGVYAYKREKFFNGKSLGLPYIIRSRINHELISRLNQDDYPILLEGLHCTGIMGRLQSKRNVVIRMHNEEGAYYRRLAATERNLIKSTYLGMESILIERYMTRLSKQVKIAAVSTSDAENFKNNYGFSDVHFIPPFIPWQTLSSLTGLGKFCLYHGNMKVPENVAAAKWLVEEIFRKLPVPFIIAGNGMPKEALNWEKKYKNIQVVTNPPQEQINQLISSAHINVLPSMNQTGVKLKLLHSLFSGRFCITNNRGINGSEIKEGVHIADTAEEYLALVPDLLNLEFKAEHIKQREPLLKIFDNNKNAVELSALL